jgi:hypothetical protein
MTDIMARYLAKYGRPRLFVFHKSTEEFASANLQFYNA